MVSMRNFAAATKSNANKSFPAGSRRCSASRAKIMIVSPLNPDAEKGFGQRLQATPEGSFATQIDRVGKGETLFGPGERLLLRLQAHHARSRGRFSHGTRRTGSPRGERNPVRRDWRASHRSASHCLRRCGGELSAIERRKGPAAARFFDPQAAQGAWSRKTD